jgi:geranylgeranyl reductase family protein
MLAFDVIVVGGGPGGSSAAAAALRRGLSVAQVDRQKFPRMKACGGGVTIKSCNALPIDLSPAVRAEARDIDFNVWQTRRNRFTRKSSAMLRMVVRPEFDDWLVSENRKRAGFEFFDGERVNDIAYDGTFFSVCTSQRTLRARHLVGADGAYSLVNKQFGVTQPKAFATAVEVVLRRDEATLAEPTPPCFDFGAISTGYGWVFPKDDHWNVGLYTLGKSKQIRQELVDYIEKKGFRVDGDPLASFAAHRFPYGGYRVTVPSAPVYIVGDAGGFGDPIMGEGIYHAIESGRIAGETIADCLAGRATPEAYYERLKPSVLTDTFVTYWVAREFYLDPDKALTILENPFVWRPFVEGYADGATFSRSLARAWWLLPKNIALGQFEYHREGDSQPLALEGPLRGVPYLCEPLVYRLQRLLGWSAKPRPDAIA